MEPGADLDRQGGSGDVFVNCRGYTAGDALRNSGALLWLMDYIDAHCRTLSLAEVFAR